MSELRLFHNWRLRNNLYVPFALQEFTQSETFLKFLINIFISESKLFVYLLSALRLSFLNGSSNHPVILHSKSRNEKEFAPRNANSNQPIVGGHLD